MRLAHQRPQFLEEILFKKPSEVSDPMSWRLGFRRRRRARTVPIQAI
jgi:hypothetical protein